MRIRRVGAVIGVLGGIGAAAALTRWPDTPLPTAVLAACILLTVIAVGWWLIERYWRRWGEATSVLVLLFCGALIGIYVGAVFYVLVPIEIFQRAANTYLFLHFSDSHTVPSEKKSANIRNWYALFTESIYVDEQDANGKPIGRLSIPPRWTVFLLFEKPPQYRQLLADCSGPNTPKCDVVADTDRYAVITILGDITFTDLEVHANP